MMRSGKYIIEFNDVAYSVLGNDVKIVRKFETVPGDKFLICDFPGTVAKVMTVETPPKYAETMVVRRLHEEGEFDEPVSIITHKKRKSGDKGTEIFFTAIASKIYGQYLDRIREHDDTVILFPLYSVLFNIFKKLPSKKPVAVVLRHSTFADILIGTKKRIVFSSRCTGFDTSPEQVTALWDMVAREISTAEEDHHIKVDKVVCLNWIDTVTDENISNAYPEYSPFDEDQVVFEGKAYQTSFIKAARMLSPGMGSNGAFNALLYYSRKTAVWAAMLLLCTSLGLMAGYWQFSEKTKVLKQQENAIQRRISQFKKEISLKPFNQNFDSVYSFVDTLYESKLAPSLGQLIHDIESSSSPAIKIEGLKITYTAVEAQTEVYGIVESGFDIAYKGYQILVQNLTNKGYAIKENNFITQIDRSEFRLIFSRGIQ